METEKRNILRSYVDGRDKALLECAGTGADKVYFLTVETPETHRQRVSFQVSKDVADVVGMFPLHQFYVAARAVTVALKVA